jgi:hypothetical protein
VVPQATPQPFPTSDAGTFSVPFNLNPFPGLTPDVGGTIGASANTGVVLPVPPAAPTPLLPPVPDPSPIAASGAPPPAAPQPVSNIALVGGDTQAARGAARYAMVRNDDDSAMAAATMALGGVVLAVFLCVLLVAPGTSSGPKPRPKGAY